MFRDSGILQSSQGFMQSMQKLIALRNDNQVQCMFVLCVCVFRVSNMQYQ